MKAKTFVFALLLAGSAAAGYPHSATAVTGGTAGTGDPLSTNAVLKSVVVYRVGAELTHTAGAVLPQGNVELAIDGVSNNIDLNSVQIHVPSTVTLLGFTYVNDYLAVRPKTARQQRLEDSLDHLTESQDQVQLSITNNDDLLDLLKKNRELKGSETGMNVANLEKLMEYYKTKSSELTGLQYQLKNRYALIGASIEKIKDQIKEEQTQNTKESGRLLLKLAVMNGGSYDFTLSYITGNAGWMPAYELQVRDAHDSVKVVYKANINQTTGLDWKQVKMALSTSVPGSWSEAPELNPLFIAFQEKQREAVIGALEGRAAGVSVASPQLDDVVVIGYGGAKEKETGAETSVSIRGLSPQQKTGDPLYVVDGQIWDKTAFTKIDASAIASINILKGAGAESIYGTQAANGVMVITLKKDLSDYTGVDEQRLNTVYTIDLPYDLPSTGKDQMVALQNMEVPALFRYFGVPKISPDIYLLADIPDWGKLNLLPGKANIMLNGTYVGLTTINPASTQDTLHLTLGKDKRIVIQRRKVSDFSSEKFLKSDQYHKYAYEITVRNNKSQNIDLTVLDQIPLSTNKDIAIALDNPGDATVNADKGELKWTIALKSGESRKVQFGYTLRYPKDEEVTLK